MPKKINTTVLGAAATAVTTALNPQSAGVAQSQEPPAQSVAADFDDAVKVMGSSTKKKSSSSRKKSKSSSSSDKSPTPEKFDDQTSTPWGTIAGSTGLALATVAGGYFVYKSFTSAPAGTYLRVEDVTAEEGEFKQLDGVKDGTYVFVFNPKKTSKLTIEKTKPTNLSVKQPSAFSNATGLKVTVFGNDAELLKWIGFQEPKGKASMVNCNAFLVKRTTAEDGTTSEEAACVVNKDHTADGVTKLYSSLSAATKKDDAGKLPSAYHVKVDASVGAFAFNYLVRAKELMSFKPTFYGENRSPLEFRVDTGVSAPFKQQDYKVVAEDCVRFSTYEALNVTKPTSNTFLEKVNDVQDQLLKNASTNVLGWSMASSSTLSEGA